MKTDSPVAIVKQRAEQLFSGVSGSHNWEHTVRVCRLCEHLGAVEGADIDVLLAAAYLHDIGREIQDKLNGAVCHAEKGAELAASVLDGLPFSETQKRNIIHCIKSHRFRGECVPETIEAKVLFDADKLDAIGAIGVARAYLFAGEIGARLHNPDIDIEKTAPYSKEDTGYREYRVKLCNIRERMITEEGKQMADGRHRFMDNFFKQFLLEHEGMR